jgi:putative endonuclease
MPDAWCVYLLELGDGHYYVGITSRLQERVIEHKSGRGPNATRLRLPVRLRWWQEVSDVDTARRLERWLKRRSRAEKLDYCAANGTWAAEPT